jgi:hypothetical protein
MNRRQWLVALAPVFLLSACARRPAERTSDKPPVLEKPPALDKSDEAEIAYAIEMGNGAGRPMQVSETRELHTGDRFRFRFQPRFEAYVYLFDRGPGQESYRKLFPDPQILVNNPIAVGKPVVVPDSPTGWLRMDEHDGDENLVLIASTAPLWEIEESPVVADRDDFEARLARVERHYRPSSFRRFEDGGWVKLFGAREKRDLAIVLRLPLLHT